MATNTDTLPVETAGATGEAIRPPRARRGALTWAVVLAACIAVGALVVTTLSGGNDDGNIPATRFDPQAERIERDAHLEGQATTYGRDSATTPSDAGDRAAVLAAAARAERIEHQAHLDGLATTHGQRPAATSETTVPAAEPEFIPGSRHMPTR